MYYDEDAKGAFYQTDVDSGEDTYTLNLLKGTKGRKIAEEVCDYVVTGGGKIIYLGDWDSEDGEGILYLYKKSKPKQIDDEVTMIFHIQTWK